MQNIPQLDAMEWEWNCPDNYRCLLKSIPVSFIQTPAVLKRGDVHWQAIPRKLNTRLRRRRRGSNGWGLIVTMEFDWLTYCLLWIIPTISIALGLSIGLSLHFHWSAGVALGIFGGSMTLMSLTLTAIGNIYKQHGLIE